MTTTISIVRTGTSIATVAWSAHRARRGVPSWDADLFRLVNGRSAAWAPFVWLPMQAGALASPLVLGAALSVRHRRADGVRVAVAGAAAWGAAKVLKRAIGRGRPGDHDDATELRLGSATAGLGYPSGHAAVAATIATVLGNRGNPSVTASLVGLAATVGIARIYVGAHYPLDVLGGWALGTAVGEMSALSRGCRPEGP